MKLLLIGLLLFLSNISLANSEGEVVKEKMVFPVMEYRIQGNTVLSTDKIEQAVYPFLGEEKSLDDVELARSALEKSFHDAGFLTVLVNIPEQDVGSGVVKLEVIEGKVAKLRVLGASYYALGAIKRKVPDFAEGAIPNFTQIQKQMAAVNGGIDRSVTPVLRASKTPGKVEVDLKVQDSLPFHQGIELNNRYSNNTTETRLSGYMRYDNLWQAGHSLNMSFQVTPEDLNQTKVISGTYMIPYAGDYWVLYGVVSKSNISAVGDYKVIGNGNIVGMRYIHPLPALKNFYHSLTLGIDYKDFKENVSVLGSDTFNTPIAYTPFNMGYDATLKREDSTTQLNTGVTFSVRGLGNDEQDFANKRYLAQSDFAYIRAGVKHTQNIYNGWQVYANVNGQLSNQPLISSEQFVAGGLDTVRGYLESSAFGDQGINTSFELRTPPLAKYVSDKIADMHGLAFYDAAYLSVNDPLPKQIDTFNLASYGLGMRLKGWYKMFAQLEFAKTLRSAGPVIEGDTRLHFRVGYDW